MSADASRKGLLQWLDERYAVRPLLDFTGAQGGPARRHTPWSGTSSAERRSSSSCIQIASGALLLMYYQPGDEHVVREHSLHHDESAVRLARSLRPLLERAPDDDLPHRPHVQHVFSQSVPQAARSSRGCRVCAVRDHSHVRLLGLSLAVERAGLLCHRRRHRFGEVRSVHRGVDAAGPARRTRGHHQHPVPLLRAPRRAAAVGGLRRDRPAPPLRAEAGNGAAGRHGRRRRAR